MVSAYLSSQITLSIYQTFRLPCYGQPTNPASTSAWKSLIKIESPMNCPSLKLNLKLPLTNIWIGGNMWNPLRAHGQKIAPQNCEYMGKLSNHQDTNQKRVFNKSLSTTKNLKGQASIQLDTQINPKGKLYILVSQRITFGGVNGPAKWSTIANQL